MKKLIEKLEKLNAVEYTAEYENGYDAGIYDAIQIVKAHDPWHTIEKDGLPEPDRLLWFLCRNRNVFLGYYTSYIENNELHYYWSVASDLIYREGNEIIVETAFDDDYDVTHYRYIPTDLPEVSK